MQSKVPKDSFHGWLVVVACSIAFFMFVGNSSCFGLLEIEIRQLFYGQASSISAINALYNGLGFGLAPVVAAFTKVVSCRLLCACGSFFCFIGFLVAANAQTLPVIIFCIGVLPGIGFSCITVPSTIMVGEYFEKRRPVALILSVLGGGVGIVVSPYIFTHLNQTYGLRGTFLILSAVSLNGIMFSFLYNINLAKSKQSRLNVLREVCLTVFDRELMRTTNFPAVTLSFLLLYIVYAIPFLFLPKKAFQLGFSEDMTSLLLSIIGISNFISRLLMAIAASRSPFCRQVLLSSSFVINSVSLLIFAIFSDFLFLAIGASFSGFSAGIFISVTPAVFLDLFGYDKLASSIGSHFLVVGLGYVIGGPLMQSLSLVLSDINTVFYVSAGCSSLSTLMLMSVTCDRYLPRRQTSCCTRHRTSDQSQKALSGDVNKVFTISTPECQTGSAIIYSDKL
ncbi:monocarboxylate transporter 12-B-like [Saccostrea echinata]|uniref:monocarboxylate transporter 12-B-like n=1 Tax=Saccostrea echinata TaxID=191078 RepID=UPI002A822B3D|nr:monocarboxylate transporter 12-B-like [Saccostrea echinata]